MINDGYKIPLSEATATTYNDNGSARNSGGILCTEGEVYHYLRMLDTAKANGPNNISARMLKQTASSVAPSLLHYSISRFLRASYKGFGRQLELSLFPNQIKHTVHPAMDLFHCYLL